MCVRAQSLQSCLTLCNPMDCSPPGSSVHGILQARILEWVAMSSSRGSSPLRDQTGLFYVSCLDKWVLYHFTTSATWEALTEVPYHPHLLEQHALREVGVPQSDRIRWLGA